MIELKASRSPLVSIYTPVYNAEKYITECVESVLHQSLTDFEWIIYDDGSTDNSYEICDSYAERDSRIKLLKGENGTSINYINDFIDNAKGKYIAFIDNDDYMGEDYLLRMITSLEKTGADCAISSYSLVDEESKKLSWYTPKLKDLELISGMELKRKFLVGYEIEGFRWNKIYKTDIYKCSRVRITNRFPADIRFEYALIDYVEKAVLVNSKEYYYRQSSGSEVSSSSFDKVYGMLETYDSIGSEASRTELPSEGEYYKAFGYINTMFLTINNKVFSKDEIRKIFRNYSWRKMVGRGLVGALVSINRYPNKREGRLRFSVKLVYVWMNWKMLSLGRNEEE